MTITEDMQAAILKVPAGAWQPAYDGDGQARDGAWTADVTGLMDLSSWPAGMRVIARKERPHPGAQLRFTDIDGLTAEQQAAEELVRRAREQGLSLTGPDGLLKQLTKVVLETALDQELTEHLGHEKNGPVLNGSRPKTVLTESTGEVGIEIPRDRDGSFVPQIVKKRQRRKTVPARA